MVEPEIVASEGEDVRHGHGSERKRRRLGIDQARHGTEGADSPSRAQPAGEFMTSTLSWPLRLSIRTDITLTCYKVRLSNMAYIIATTSGHMYVLTHHPIRCSWARAQRASEKRFF